jgi:hypothetical protein
MSTACHVQTTLLNMLHEEILVRHDAGGRAFIYSVRRDGIVVELGTVAIEEEVAAGYYGGSEAMD